MANTASTQIAQVRTRLLPPPAGGSPFPFLKQGSSCLAAKVPETGSLCYLCCLRKAQDLPPAPLLHTVPPHFSCSSRENIYSLSPALSKASLIYAAASANTSSSNSCCRLPQRQHIMEAKGLGGESSRSSESHLSWAPACPPSCASHSSASRHGGARAQRDPYSCRQLVETAANCFLVPTPLLLLFQGWVRKGK